MTYKEWQSAKLMLKYLRRRFFKITRLRSGSNAESYINWYMSAAGHKYSSLAYTTQAVRPATHKCGWMFKNVMLQYLRRRFLKLFGCVPALIQVHSFLFFWQLRVFISILYLCICYLCGLRFTRSQPVILPEDFTRRFAHLIVMLSISEASIKLKGAKR